MSEAREIVTETIRRHQASPAAAISNWVFHELTAAGFRILGPDEVDPVTLEKAVVAAEERAEWVPLKAGDMATAIRALGRKA